MTTARLESLTWICIYGGLAGLMLGGWGAGFDATLGRVLGVAGGVLVLLGALMVWLRSRRPAKAVHDDDGTGA